MDTTGPNPVFAPLEAALGPQATPAAWLGPHASIASEVLQLARAQPLPAALNAAGSRERFVPHTSLPPGEAYEAFVHRTGRVPTRDNLHDFFNGLMWLRYPRTKERLNALQAAEIERLGTRGARGVLRDALTLFDENAALLRAPAGLIDALRRRDWRSAFVEQRSAWQVAQLELFGHALLEKLLVPRKAITAHVWLVDEISDDALTLSLVSERLAAKSFLPLPVLGVPGWWKENELAGFYDDAAVFRPGTR